MTRYSKLGYVALNVTDVARARPFYETLLGLQYVGEGPDGSAFLRCSYDHHNVVLSRAAAPGLKRIGWELESEAEREKLFDRLSRAGHRVWEIGEAECAALHQGPSFRMVEPTTGTVFEFYAAIREFSGQPYAATHTNIQRLGHVVLKSPRFADTVSFLTRELGFKLSDEIAGTVAFLRCWPNPFHHSLAIGKGKEAALHHVNFMVSEIDDIGKAIHRFNKNQVPIVHGPGRHPPSGSVFLYFLDPDGITIEYSFGMETFPRDEARKPRIMEPIQPSFDYWDCPVDPRKSAVGGIETAPERHA
jgi:2,3-dihydroxy-p-cumate/2,3-dihydroxybenzoate 3,4-dioxygenase